MDFHTRESGRTLFRLYKTIVGAMSRSVRNGTTDMLAEQIGHPAIRHCPHLEAESAGHHECTFAHRQENSIPRRGKCKFCPFHREILRFHRKDYHIYVHRCTTIRGICVHRCTSLDVSFIYFCDVKLTT